MPQRNPGIDVSVLARATCDPGGDPPPTCVRNAHTFLFVHSGPRLHVYCAFEALTQYALCACWNRAAPTHKFCSTVLTVIGNYWNHMSRIS